MLSRAELRRGLELVLGEITNEEFEIVMSSFDEDHSGSVNLKELEHAVRDGSANGSHISAAARLVLSSHKTMHAESSRPHALTRRMSVDDGDEEFVIAALRSALAHQHARVMDLFTKWDDDGSGEISLFEFRGGLALLGLDASLSVATTIFNSFDVDHNGKIDYTEMVHALKQSASNHSTDHGHGEKAAAAASLQRTHLRTGLSSPRRSIIGSSLPSTRIDKRELTVKERLRRALAANFARVIDLFREWDDDHNGSIDNAEFYRAMAQLGLTSERSHANELFNTFDVDGDGIITLSEMDMALRPQPEPPDPYEHDPRQRVLKAGESWPSPRATPRGRAQAHTVGRHDQTAVVPMAVGPVVASSRPPLQAPPSAEGSGVISHGATSRAIVLSRSVNAASVHERATPITAAPPSERRLPPLDLSAFPKAQSHRDSPRMYSPRAFLSSRQPAPHQSDVEWYHQLLAKHEGRESTASPSPSMRARA